MGNTLCLSENREIFKFKKGMTFVQYCVCTGCSLGYTYCLNWAHRGASLNKISYNDSAQFLIVCLSPLLAFKRNTTLPFLGQGNKHNKMKICFRLTFFLCLLLPITLSAAQELVQIRNFCGAGESFFITIPVKLESPDTAFYRWYCDGELINDPSANGVATFNNHKISYTIPANTHSGSVAFHFTYRLNDGCDEWTKSPVYLVTFETWAEGDCQLSVGAIFGAGLLDCALDSGRIDGVGVTSCSLYAGIIGSGTVPDFPPCELIVGSVAGLGYLDCALDSGSIDGIGILGCSLYAGMIGGGTVPDFSPCELIAGEVEALGYLDCALDSGSIDGVGILGCSLYAGIIGGGSVPNFPPCELTAGSVAGAGYLDCALDSGSIAGVGVLGCSLYAGRIGGGAPPEFEPCNLTAGSVAGAGYVSCSLNAGIIRGEGIKGCSLNAGRIGN